MTGKGKKRSFRLSPSAAAFVGEAKVQTDQPHDRHAGRRDTDPLPVPDQEPQTAGRRSVDTHVAHGTGYPGMTLHDALQASSGQHKPAQHSTDRREATQDRRHPWEDLSAGGKTINFKFTPELYAMATWCKNNVPGGVSYLELLRMGCAMVCADLIKKHYKPEE